MTCPFLNPAPLGGSAIRSEVLPAEIRLRLDLALTKQLSIAGWVAELPSDRVCRSHALTVAVMSELVGHGCIGLLLCR